MNQNVYFFPKKLVCHLKVIDMFFKTEALDLEFPPEVTIFKTPSVQPIKFSYFFNVTENDASIVDWIQHLPKSLSIMFGVFTLSVFLTITIDTWFSFSFIKNSKTFLSMLHQRYFHLIGLVLGTLSKKNTIWIKNE